MKIVQFLASKGSGGLENVFVDLCNALAKTKALEVIVFKDAACIKKLDTNIQIHELPKKSSRYNIFLYIKLYKLMKKISPDIVHTHAVKATQIFYYVNKFLALPCVATKHNPRKGKVFNSLPHVIAVSKGVRESIANENVQVIYNGVKPVEVLHQMKNDEFTLLAVGRLDKVKGFDILIEACAKSDFSYHLQIVGEGEERESLETLISKLNLKDKVTLLGFRQDIPQLMKNADVVVMSSYSEGFSLVMVESLFYANLFISTKVSGATEILEEQFLYTHDETVSKLEDVYLNLTEYQNEFNILKQNIKNRFLLEHIAREHSVYYESVIGEQIK